MGSNKNKLFQPSILNYTKTKEGNNTISLMMKPYFYLDWDFKKFSPFQNAQWLDVNPKKSGKIVTFCEIIKIENKDFKLCSSFIPTNRITNETNETYHDSFITSHLQKSVRRNLQKQAIWSANILLLTNPVKLLRRLPIIMVEDSVLHESFTTLVWLMCLLSIKKGEKYSLSIVQKCWILGVVNFLAFYSYKLKIKLDDKYEWNFNKNIKKINKGKNVDIINILYSSLARRNYGGMKDDISMLKKTELYFYQNTENIHFWESYKNIFKYNLKPVQINKCKLELREMIPEAFDFHCYKPILDILKNTFDLEENKIKEAIWNKSSGYHRKNFIIILNKGVIIIRPKIINDENINQIWNIIKDFYKKFTSSKIYHIHNELSEYFPKLLVVRK